VPKKYKAIHEVQRVGVPGQVLCAILDCSDRQLRMYEEEGLAIKVDRNRYLLAPTIKNIVKKLREQAAGRLGRSDGTDIVASNAALKDVERQIRETKLAQMRGELVNRPSIVETWRELVMTVRQLFLAVPARARHDLPHLTPKDQEILERLCRDMLTEIALAEEIKIPAAKAEVANVDSRAQH
jgi:phage terminase Nu1 subunit (DNA packaging protein)